MKNFNKISITLYLLASLLFLLLFISELVETNIIFFKYIDSLDNSPIFENFIFWIFIPISFILGIIAYASSYRVICVKLLPLFILVAIYLISLLAAEGESRSGIDFILNILVSITIIYALSLLIIATIVRRLSRKSDPI